MEDPDMIADDSKQLLPAEDYQIVEEQKQQDLLLSLSLDNSENLGVQRKT